MLSMYRTTPLKRLVTSSSTDTPFTCLEKYEAAPRRSDDSLAYELVPVNKMHFSVNSISHVDPRAPMALRYHLCHDLNRP